MDRTDMYITAEVYSILLSLYVLGLICACVQMEKEHRKHFINILCIIVVNLLANIAVLALNGADGKAARLLLILANVLEYSFGYLLSFVFSRYLIYRISDFKRKRAQTNVFLAILLVQVLILFFSQIFDIYYYIDADNNYVRTETFWVSQIIAFVPLVIDFILCMVYRKRFSVKELLGVISYIALPIITMSVQAAYDGLNLFLPATAICVAVMFALIMDDQRTSYEQREKTISDMRSSIMLSQIQPHFLYNTLSAIAQLCEEDPSKAKSATITFSDYLYGNMKSLSNAKKIPFEEELLHVDKYVSLEKIRFNDAIDVRYEIAAKDFTIPPLTLQPVVENAIKHGVSLREDGGKIVISSNEYADRYEITVEDDGVGFDPEKVYNDTRLHIGLSNVRLRLEMVCNGKLTVKSRIGKGTKVQITIPKPKGCENE